MKGADSATAEIRIPASAGPMARAMLMPIEFSAIAGCRVARGTRLGTTACQAGAISAAPVPIAKVKARSRAGVIAPAAVSAAIAPTTPVRTRLTRSRNRRRSTRSASAPANSAKRKIGAVVAACTSVTIAGDESSVVISQPAPTSCIQVPMLEISDATHSSAKARYVNGDQADAGFAAGLLLLHTASIDPAGARRLFAGARSGIAYTAKQEQPSTPQKDLRSRTGTGLAQAIRWSWPWMPQALAHPSWQLRACRTDGCMDADRVPGVSNVPTGVHDGLAGGSGGARSRKSSAPWTTLPPTMVITALMRRISSGVTDIRSAERIARSAYWPGARVPLTSRSPENHADPCVQSLSAVSRSSTFSSPYSCVPPRVLPVVSQDRKSVV